jgi:hypothetical protein
MALNQTIVSPITNITGSLSSFTSPLRNTLQIISSSLPTYQATEWEYKILTTPFTTTINTAQNVTGLRLTLANSKKYIINGYLLVSSQVAANGIRIGITTSNIETYYYNESPNSISGMQYGFNASINAAAAASTNVNDYQLVQIRAIAITPASGVPTFTPTIHSENNGFEVRMGPSIIYYRQY